ncbi:NHL repeat-containing protein [Actinacidiphila yanglinensis]|uniref:hypothetical protein n=1 Tax=Actinacidiphila yanglinensis TaxID=310779 RepID=UPI000CDEDE6A|nr:hypothetical protein [Actinacidiphila yanglinensis]
MFSAACLLAAAACGGHSGPPGPPKAGQARVIGQTTGSGDIGPATVDGERGIAAAAGGVLYINTSERLVRLGADGAYTDVSGQQAGEPAPEDRGLSGVVVRGDGTLLTGENGRIVAVAPSGRLTVLAGTAGHLRSLTASLANSAPATGFRLTNEATPLAVEKDGTVVIADGNAVWSLANGRLTLRYRQAPEKDPQGYVSTFNGSTSAADPDGTAFLAPITPHTLTDVVVLPGDGRAPHKLELPAHVSGVKVPTAQLAPASLAGDGANGVYVTTYDANKRGAYVLHVHDGRADLVAASTASAASATCDVHKAVAARDFPCYFPTGIAYHSGHVYLAGNRSYVVDIGIGT